jgi:hypothetical protein
MANSLGGGRQIFADTPGLLRGGPLEINQITFTGGFVIGQKAVLTDGSGNVIWVGTTSGALGPVTSPKIGRVTNLTLQSIDAGSVIIYCY